MGIFFAFSKVKFDARKSTFRRSVWAVKGVVKAGPRAGRDATWARQGVKKVGGRAERDTAKALQGVVKEEGLAGRVFYRQC